MLETIYARNFWPDEAECQINKGVADGGQMLLTKRRFSNVWWHVFTC